MLRMALQTKDPHFPHEMQGEIMRCVQFLLKTLCRIAIIGLGEKLFAIM